jgi:predicted ATPase
MAVESTMIRTPDQRLRVFVSSTLRELAAERAATRTAIERLMLSPVMFETGSRPHPPRELYRSYLRQSDIFVGIYGASYGWIAPGEEISGLEDEYRLAEGMPRLIYLTDSHGAREARLDALIDRIRERDDVAYVTFNHPQELGELVARDLAVLVSERFDRTGLGTVPTPDDALPSSLDSLVGRDSDVESLESLLRGGRDRLVTLTGPGGVGKTRLALAAAARAADGFPGGAHFIDLAPLRDPADVMSQIAASLGATDVGDGRLEHRVGSALRTRPPLLIVDNLEQVLPAAPQLAHLLVAAPGAAILATSRVALGVAGEHRIEVQPLTTGVDGSRDGIGAAEQLFLDRAGAAGATTGELDLDDIRAVCRTLDGLPLAIELAAARTSVLTPAELRERLAAGTDVLPVAGPDRPERQRTLARTIDWSIDLLDDEARAVFDALGVFAGGFDLAAATAVVGGDALQPLSRLVDASLIVRETDGRSSRFSMLTTVRAASIHRAAEAGSTVTLADRHAEHFLAVARREGRLLYGPEGVETIARLRAEQENLRTAARTLLDRHRADDLVRIASWLFTYWWVVGRQGEVRAWMRELWERGPLAGRTRAWALYYTGSISFGDADRSDVLHDLRESAEAFRAAGDPLGEAIARSALAFALTEGPGADNFAAESEIATALEIFRPHRHAYGLTWALVTDGRMRLSAGDVPAARAAFAEAVELSTTERDEFTRGIAEHFLGVAEFLSGDLETAGSLFRNSLRCAVRLSHAEGISYGLEALCAVAAELGHDEQAATLLGAARTARRISGVYNSPPPSFFNVATRRLEETHAGDEAFQARRDAGMALGTAAAAALALDGDVRYAADGGGADRERSA